MGGGRSLGGIWGHLPIISFPHRASFIRITWRACENSDALAHPQSFPFRSGMGSDVCISSKSPGKVDTVGLWTTLREEGCRRGRARKLELTDESETQTPVNGGRNDILVKASYSLITDIGFKEKPRAFSFSR